MPRWIIPPLLLATCLTAQAQQSASYKLGEHALNAGGHPSGGTLLTSTSYRITLDSLGVDAVGRNLTGPSYRMDASFASAYPPPGEVGGLLFSDKTTLDWNPEKSAGSYNLYRDSLNDLSGLGYGVCLQENIAGPTTTDSDPVPAGDGFFYLVTAENRLDEEGSKGPDSGGTIRAGNACP